MAAPSVAPSDELDAVARAAAAAVDVPIGLVTLVDGEWIRFVGAHGLTPPLSASRRILVTESFCQDVVASGAPVVVGDTGDDPRSRPSGASVRVAAYMGVPLRGPDGGVVGVVCAVDARTRDWSAADVGALQGVAARAARLPALTTPTPSELTGRDPDAPEAGPHSLFLQALLDSLDTAVFACDAAGCTMFGNTALLRMLDLDGELPPDAAAIAVDHLRDGEGRPLTSERHPTARALAGEPVRDVDLRLLRPGRPPRMLVANAERITVAGAVMGVVVALHDVTEQRRAQRFQECALAVSRALVEADRVADAARQVVDAVARSLHWPHAELWLVDPVPEVLRPAASWTDGDLDRPGLMSTQLGRGEGLAGTTWLRGEPVWVPDIATESRFDVEGAARRRLRTALAVPVRSAEAVVGVLALYADTLDEDRVALTAHLVGIAAHLGHYLERRRAEELALQLARTKDDFLALVGHELRTPLTSITTYAQLLTDDPECWTTSGPQLLGVIRRNTESLTAIINDLLDLAGLESGHITIRPVDTDLAELTREGIEAVRAAADGRAVTLVADLPDRLRLHGDPQRLRQMLDNVLSNAVKYSNEGGRVTVRLVEEAGVATLTVADTGIGIPPAERDRLFQRFFRSSTARERGVPGTGLGLVVTRAIVERHGGRIGATHTDPGTTMVIRLPTAAPDDE
ncbi:sensor histidine kinase [Cryptosporangium aurantiacum]|uniref:histidine kinase n=1 Tax=Cryptosporangium aurantiacum TaxID=134849 RepID=A0A1M7RMM5_9ACTN|nr:GAF domain-containing sensor histidine kinase [Cryptosporangium aurantiacum]SHN47346.1 Signal transduction histidine kinase [Cryptosporangium aurantiacum]